MADYFNVTTNLGDAEIATAITNNTKLDITHIAFGDGNGAVPTPNKARTTLIREVHRQAVTKYERHATQANWIVIETVIPSSIGGFTIREMGIIANGKLISHGSHAPFEKVADPNGVSEYRLRFVQDITDASVVAITLDQSLIYATQAWVETNYIRRNEVVDNLTSNDATKPISAKQGKILQENKLDANKRGAVSGVASLDENKKVPVSELPSATGSIAGVMKLVDNLTSGGTDAAITAEQVKLFFAMFVSSHENSGYQKIPNPNNPSKPLIIQWSVTPYSSSSAAVRVNFPIAFPNAIFNIIATSWDNGFGCYPTTNNKNLTGFDYSCWTAINTRASTGIATYYLAIGN